MFGVIPRSHRLSVLQRDVPHGQHVQIILREVILTVPLVVVLHLKHLRSPGPQFSRFWTGGLFERKWTKHWEKYVRIEKRVRVGEKKNWKNGTNRTPEKNSGEAVGIWTAWGNEKQKLSIGKMDAPLGKNRNWKPGENIQTYQWYWEFKRYTYTVCMYVCMSVCLYVCMDHHPVPYDTATSSSINSIHRG